MDIGWTLSSNSQSSNASIESSLVIFHIAPLSSSTMNGISSGPVANLGAMEDSKYWKDDFTPLQTAGASILQVLRQDEAAADADLYRRITSSAAATTGTETNGANNSNQNKSHLYFEDSSPVALSQLCHQRSIPIPPFLTPKLAKCKVSTYMGLFPQAELAWMTVDDTLYLWSFKNPSGAATAGAGLHMRQGYNPSMSFGPSQNSYHANATSEDFLWFTVPSHRPIVSVGLVPPKQGMEEVDHQTRVTPVFRCLF